MKKILILSLRFLRHCERRSPRRASPLGGERSNLFPSSLRGTKQSGLLKKIAAATLWLRNDGNIILAMTVVAGLYLFLGATPAWAANLYWVGNDAAATNVASNWKTTDPAGCGGGL